VGARVLHLLYLAGGDNSPLQQQQVDPNTVRISTDYLRGVEKILEMAYFDKKFSGVPSKNISFTATFYWNSINSSWVSAASTPVVSSCRSSAPPLPSVNDGSLPTNTSEDAQKSSGTYKNFHFIFAARMWMCLFASVETSVMSVTKKGFKERAATVFEKKVAKLFDNVGNQLFNKLNISGIFLLLFSPNASEID